MKAFTQTAADHFVKGFVVGTTAPSGSLRDYLQLTFRRGIILAEGKPEFAHVRDCLLRESERYLLMSVNCYARALDVLRPASSYWSVVSLYYCTFFAAKSLLGMFGCWMRSSKMWLEAVDVTPGALKLAYRRFRYPGSGGGSHRDFWKAYYKAVTPLSVWIKPSLTLAITPVNSSETWLIDTRNELNYEGVEALKLSDDFVASYDPTNIPGCFPGKLGTMYSVADAFVGLVRDMAIGLSLSTDVCQSHPTRTDWITNQVTSAVDAPLVAFSQAEYAKLTF